MKDYNKMLNTAKAIQDAFGSAEFTRKQYNEKVGKNPDVYDAATIFMNKRYAENPLTRSKYIVKVTRTEDFIAKDEDGDKYVGTRYFYEINGNFMDDLRKELANDIVRLKESIYNYSKKIDEMNQRIEDKKALIEVLSNI